MPTLLRTDTNSLLRQTLRNRMVEERIIDIYPSDKIQSPVHLSIGQEAAAVGICAPLANDDLLFSNYRGHAYYLAKGGDLKLRPDDLAAIERELPVGWAHGDRYSVDQWVGPQKYC